MSVCSYAGDLERGINHTPYTGKPSIHRWIVMSPLVALLIAKHQRLNHQLQETVLSPIIHNGTLNTSLLFRIPPPYTPSPLCLHRPIPSRELYGYHNARTNGSTNDKSDKEFCHEPALRISPVPIIVLPFQRFMILEDVWGRFWRGRLTSGIFGGMRCIVDSAWGSERKTSGALRSGRPHGFRSIKGGDEVSAWGVVCICRVLTS